LVIKNQTREILNAERTIRRLLDEARESMTYTTMVAVETEKRNKWICEMTVRFLTEFVYWKIILSCTIL
jgi:hypothetical protein